MPRLLMVAGLFVCLLLLLGRHAAYANSTCTSPVHGCINFQGKVVNADGTNVTNGAYNFDFVLYDDTSLGTPSDGVHDKWHELTKSVTVTNGVFQTNLGSATNLPDFNAFPNLYLAVRFNADAAGYMTPRVQLGAVPYALNADNLSGLTSSSFVQLAQGLQADSSTTNPSIFINKTNGSGSPNILQLQKAGADVFSVSNTGLVTAVQGLTLTGTTSINGSGSASTTIGNSAGGTITIGASSGSDLVLNDANWSVSGAGNAAFVQVTSPTYTSAAGLTIDSGNNTLTIAATDTTLSATGLTAINLAAGPTINASSGNIKLTGTATGVSAALLVLPTKTDVGDPTTAQVNGGLYYNSNTGKFRCYQNSAWTDCIGAGGATDLQAAYTNSANPAVVNLNTSAKDIQFNLNDLATDPNFIVNASTSSTGRFAVQYNGADTFSISNAASAQGAALFKNAADSTTAFQIQNAAGTQAINVATTSANLIANSNFESNTNGWSAANPYVTGTISQSGTAITGAGTTFTTNMTGDTIYYNDGTTATVTFGTATTLTSSVTKTVAALSTYAVGAGLVASGAVPAQYGNQSLAITTTTIANMGASYRYSLAPSTTYTFSLYARLSSGSSSNITIGHQNVNGTDVNDCASQPLTTTFTRFTCSFTTPAAGSITYPTSVFIKQSDATAKVIYIDGAQLEAAAATTIYNPGLANLQVETATNTLTLNGNNGGSLSSWNTNAYALPQTLTYATSVTANGYIYEIDGHNGTNKQATVYYAKVNADGSTGTWTTNANAVPTATQNPGAVVANGYVYVMGGDNNSATSIANVYYAKLNADGSTGSWQNSTNLPVALNDFGAVVANGYVYVIGGNNTSTGGKSAVYYAKLNADGSTGAWQTNSYDIGCTTPGCGSPQALNDAGTVVANGYVYLIGGYDGTPGQTVRYAKLNADGSTGGWQSGTNLLPQGLISLSSVVANGYVYAIGGTTNLAGTTFSNNVYYAKLNADGSTSAWQTNATNLPQALNGQTSLDVNGYVYVLGGLNAATQSTVYYASGERLKVGGSLDLVGEGGQTLADVGGAGSLTAGNGTFVGSLQVQDQASFAQSVAIAGNLTDSGTVAFKNTTNSATALQVQNSGGSNLISLDTTGANQNNVIQSSSPNPSFENNSFTGWTGAGGCTLSAVTAATTPPFNGSYSGQCSNTATIGAEFKSTTGALTASTVYTLNFYAKVSAYKSDNSTNTLDFGHVENGGAENAAGLSLTSQAVSTSGWVKYSLTFKTGATLAAGDYIYIKQNDATARSVWIDGVTLQTDANANNNYREGKIEVGGIVDSSLILQNAANSTTAFQVQNAAGIAVFTVDTTDTNLMLNAGGEVNTVGWAGKGTNGTIIRDTSQQKYGYASFKLTGTAANDGAQYTFPASLPGNGAIAYQIGISVKTNAAFPANTLVFGFVVSAADVNCSSITPAVTATVPSTTGWTRFTCNITPAAAATGFYVKQTDATSHAGGYWVDGIEIDSGATLSPHGAGAININGIVRTPFTLQNQSNSTSAFTLLDTSSNTLLSVDTLNDIASIGSTGAQALASTTNIGTSTGATQTVNIGSAGAGTAAAGTLINIQGGTTANTAIVLGTNGAGGITIDTGTTGGILVGAGTSNNAKTITLGPTATKTSATTFQIGINTAGTETIQIGSAGSGDAAAGTTINVQGGTTANTAVKIGTNGAGGITIDSGSTGIINIGNGAAAKTVIVGSTNTTSKLTLQAGANTTTTGKAVVVGSDVADAVQTNFQLDTDNTFNTQETASSCTATVNQGAMYYNSASNSIRACDGGTLWQDVVTADTLGIQLFGVVPDTGVNGGDIAGVVSTTGGPCKVSVGADTAHVAWTACTAYSGGRKVVVTASNAATTNAGAGNFQHLCLNAANTNQPALTTAAAEATNQPAFSLSAPILCIADIRFNGANTTITQIYDTRVFTSSQKMFATVGTTAPTLGMLVQSTTTRGVAIPIATLNGGSLLGVIAASSGAVSTTTVNAIISIDGPVAVKAITGNNLTNDFVQGSGTAGYAITNTTANTTNVYGILGQARTPWSGATACSANADVCQGSVVTTIKLR